MDQPVIKEVTVTKVGRFWAVWTDGNLLAMVLYRKGARAVQELVQRLTGITPTPPPASTASTSTEAPNSRTH